MMMTAEKLDIFTRLQEKILRLQGFKPSGQHYGDLDLGPFESAFPNKTFPLGAVHEFVSSDLESAAVTNAFMVGLISSRLQNSVALWITSNQLVFPPALSTFGVQPDRIIFLHVKKQSDILWAIDESLKCGAVTAVIGELNDLNFKMSRRFQLAVEESQVTGFIHRRNEKKLNTTACVTRWKITSLPSESIDGLPGVGYPTWKVELLKVRNGKPGAWNVKWINGKFITIEKPEIISQERLMKVG